MNDDSFDNRNGNNRRRSVTSMVLADMSEDRMRIRK